MGSFEYGSKTSGSVNGEEFLDQQSACHFLKKELLLELVR
jgi:hypothetical protein